MTTPSDARCRIPHARFKTLLGAGVLAVITFLHPGELSNQISAAEPLSQKDEFAQWLQEPHTGLVDGRSLRLAFQIAAAHQTQPSRHINTWVDRRVNPDSPVSPGSLGPTRYASLCKIAASAGCVCYPLDNCVVIGRPAWVAELSRQVYSPADDAAPNRHATGGVGNRIDLQWPDLTTPNEALELVRGHMDDRRADLPAVNTFPHDLWPETSLRDISPQLALQLIAGQFLDVGKTDENVAPFTRTYQFAAAQDALKSIQNIDPNLHFDISGGRLRLQATPAAHQAFCQQMLSIPRGDSPADQPIPAGANALVILKQNERVFSLEVTDKPAGALIQALVAQLGLQCQFDPAANPQLEKRVSLSAVDQTLWQLVRLITDQASLKIEAAGDKLRVSAKN